MILTGTEIPTPRTFEAGEQYRGIESNPYNFAVVSIDFARDLERELHEANARAERLLCYLREIHTAANDGNIPDGRNLHGIVQTCNSALAVENALPKSELWSDYQKRKEAQHK
jgi:hypothetical protein